MRAKRMQLTRVGTNKMKLRNNFQFTKKLSSIHRGPHFHSIYIMTYNIIITVGNSDWRNKPANTKTTNKLYQNGTVRSD